MTITRALLIGFVIIVVSVVGLYFSDPKSKFGYIYQSYYGFGNNTHNNVLMLDDCLICGKTMKWQFPPGYFHGDGFVGMWHGWCRGGHVQWIAEFKGVTYDQVFDPYTGIDRRPEFGIEVGE